MEQQQTRKMAGIDIGHKAVQFSIYDASMHEMEDVYLPMDEPSRLTIEKGYARLLDYMKEYKIEWKDFESVVFSLEDASKENRILLQTILGKDFMKKYNVTIITRFRAFAEFIFRQDRVNWDTSAILFDYTNEQVTCTIVEQIAEAKQKAYRAYQQNIALADFGIRENSEEKDQKFAEMLKVFLSQHAAQVICLTGEGFGDDWMNKTRALLCANGRLVLRSLNFYANGAAIMNGSVADLLEEGLVLMSGPDMVQHTIGVVTSKNAKVNTVPITNIGREWYNTSGSLDIILDKSQKVDIFYYNAKENMMQSVVCEMSGLPKRPEHTTRIRVSVSFSSALEGVVLLQDMGFGSMYPATNKVRAFPFTLIL